MANYETAVCATLVAYFLEKYSSGRRGAPAKGVGRVTGAEVQIFSSPPNKMGHFLVSFFILFGGEDLNFIRGGYYRQGREIPLLREMSQRDKRLAPCKGRDERTQWVKQ